MYTKIEVMAESKVITPEANVQQARNLSKSLAPEMSYVVLRLHDMDLANY